MKTAKTLDWSEAILKRDSEGACRICGDAHVEAAHVMGRKHDRGFVHPDRIVPLCPRHHVRYDAHDLDIMGVLTLDEQLQAVIDAGGIERARRRIVGPLYRHETAAA